MTKKAEKKQPIVTGLLLKTKLPTLGNYSVEEMMLVVNYVGKTRKAQQKDVLIGIKILETQKVTELKPKALRAKVRLRSKKFNENVSRKRC